MDKMQVKRLAVKVFKKDLLPDVINLIDEDSYLEWKKVLRLSEKELELSQEEVLDSVFKGDCDFVLFDHYKHCRNFDNAVTQYIEENDTRS
jgi:hypothetical protein